MILRECNFNIIDSFIKQKSSLYEDWSKIALW